MMKSIPVTPDFLDRMGRCVSRLEQHARQLEDCDEFKLENMVGSIIRQAAEVSRQDAAVLKDLIERYSEDEGV